jgi:hypothetical protein
MSVVIVFVTVGSGSLGLVLRNTFTNHIFYAKVHFDEAASHDALR